MNVEMIAGIVAFTGILTELIARFFKLNGTIVRYVSVVMAALGIVVFGLSKNMSLIYTVGYAVGYGLGTGLGKDSLKWFWELVKGFSDAPKNA
jgi:Na+-transporting NADH:ubiquinone oxidoreductase subunit NqrE